MDPISSLSLASCILQVIDFTSGFATTAWRIYQAADRGQEGPDEMVQLRDINLNLTVALREIRSEAKASEIGNTSCNNGIIQLAKDCEKVVEALLRNLQDLTNVKRKRDALRAAFKSKWKNSEIRALQAKVAEFRSQLTMQVLLSLRQFAGKSLAQQEKLLKELSGNQKHGFSEKDTSIERVGTSILDYVTSKLNPTSQLEERRFLQTLIAKTIRSDYKQDSEDGNPTTNMFVSAEVRLESLESFIASLDYDAMYDREIMVAKAHATTFRWLFDENNTTRKTTFQDWLSSEEPLYWITGKPGSGKSTLMKYVTYPDEHEANSKSRPRCHKYLSKWGNQYRLIIASFYFWNSGARMQKTRTGLMKTLLRQIIVQCPDLALVASPTRWETLCLFGDFVATWDDQELQDALHRAIAKAQLYGAKIALFIDGLDEFEGKSREIIELLLSIKDLPNLKLCVSSRPWTEFEDVFHLKPSLRLEYLTHGDIKQFVESKFKAEPLFQELRLREGGQFADTLTDSIVHKAQGVFLWVALVVSSLIAGLTSGDRVSDLEDRLALLPPDLEDLYGKILSSLDPSYRVHAGQLFSLIAASQESLNVVMASFADEKAPSFCLSRPIQMMSKDQTLRYVDVMRRRINTRTRGLLEIKRPHEADASLDHETYTIEYLHRTVKDYIQGKEAQNIFGFVAQSSFDPHLQLLAGRVAYIKSLDHDKIDMNLIGKYLFQCMESARNVNPSNISSMIVVLEELDKVITTLWKSQSTSSATNTLMMNSSNKGLWALGFQPVPVYADRTECAFGSTFLSLAVACNVVEYVRARAPPSCIIQQPFLLKGESAIRFKPWNLLMDTLAINVPFACRIDSLGHSDYFTTPSMSSNNDDGRSALVPMLECLISKGADPMYEVVVYDKPTSLLCEFVVHMMQTNSPLVADATRILLHGRDVNRNTLESAIRRYETRTMVYGKSRYVATKRGGRTFPWKKNISQMSLTKTLTRHLKIALDDLRDHARPESLLHIPELFKFKNTIDQLVAASWTWALLTPAAKYCTSTYKPPQAAPNFLEPFIPLRMTHTWNGQETANDFDIYPLEHANTAPAPRSGQKT